MQIIEYMGIKERLTEFIQSKRLSVAAFERACGLSNGFVKNTKGNIGAVKLNGILDAFPELSRDWLIDGTGEMLVSAAPSPVGGDEAAPPQEPRTAKAPTVEEVTAALEEIRALRLMLDEQMRINKEQFNALTEIITNLTKK